MPQLTLEYLAFSAFTVAVYWFLPERWKSWFLAASSSAFLLYLDAISFLVLVTLIAAVFYYAKKQQSTPVYIWILSAILVIFCGIRVAQLLNKSGMLQHSILLIGYGFYCLKLIHFAVDTRSQLFRPFGFLDFYCYMLFYPTLTIGPIHRFENFLSDTRRIRWNENTFAAGLERILYGYAKVIVVANWLVAIKLDSIFDAVPGGTAMAVFGDSLVYGFYLYFAFSGYSDLAIGLSFLFGYHVGENFNYPFLKPNIGEFWQSWHMSLSAWCRQYVFLPVFAKWRRLSVALIATMLAIALWHEFSLRFLLWGIYHGIGLLIWRMYQQHITPRLPRMENSLWKKAAYATSVCCTFLFVMIGFTIVRSESFDQIVSNFKQLMGV